jgi:cytochrome c oxidase subunit 3
MAAGAMTAGNPVGGIPSQPGRRKPVVPSGVLGMLIFVVTEVMFFSGFISAFTIVRASATMGWPPPGQPRLPAMQTAVNTACLMLSGVALFVAWLAFKKSPSKARVPFLVAMLLGFAFVSLQGVEWVALLQEGLTLTSSTHGAFFYTIVGTHGLHAVGALAALGWAFGRLSANKLDATSFLTVAIFWYFVVGLWPFLYGQVYF